MSDLSIFIVGDKPCPEKITTNNSQYINIKNASSSKYSIHKVAAKINELPQKTDSRFVLICHSDIFVSNSFIDLAISTAELFQDAALISGPIKTDNKNTISRVYEYDLGSLNAEIANITNEQNNYPPINGSIISGNIYNRFTYSPIISHRHSSVENKRFIKMASNNNILYSKNLIKIKHTNEEDLKISRISDHSYDLGYQHGSLLFENHDDQQTKRELWFKFVESPEILDRDMPRWFTKSETKENELKDIVIMKCKYQIGFFEGLTNQQLI
jgi:hypothetical protein